jgi:putative ABC transport system ATP-binding protein
MGRAVAATDWVFDVRQLQRDFHVGDVVVRALRGVDLRIARGELLVMLGASGSGKSTLVNLLGGLDRPSGGEIWFQGKRLDLASDRDLTRYRREHVAFVFQFYNLIPSLTARENVEVVTELASAPMSAEEALALVGLEDRQHHFPSQLSGGEQQRVAIARAVAKRPNVLFCDEPTGALDSVTGVQVLSVIEHINQVLGTTTAIITHNQALSAMADRTVRLLDGRVQESVVNAHRQAAAELRW